VPLPGWHRGTTSLAAVLACAGAGARGLRPRPLVSGCDGPARPGL